LFEPRIQFATLDHYLLFQKVLAGSDVWGYLGVDQKVQGRIFHRAEYAELVLWIADGRDVKLQYGAGL
jgi:hypothetical protein